MVERLKKQLNAGTWMQDSMSSMINLIEKHVNFVIKEGRNQHIDLFMVTSY